MITKEALESYTQRINAQLTQLDKDYKHFEGELKGFKESNNEVTIKKVFKEWKNQNNKDNAQILKSWDDWIDEYTDIEDELKQKLGKVDETRKLRIKEENLEEKLEYENVVIEDKKEELRQKNPSYARSQERFKNRRLGKIPEIVSIPNK